MSTLTILLIALAISDILAPQANALLAFSFYHLSNSYGNSVNFLKFNDILRHIIQPLSTMFTMCSSWIVTLTTLFRLIAVKWPFKARTLINKKKACGCLMIIFGFSFASIMPLYASLIRKVKCTRDSKSQYVAFDMEITSEIMAKAYVPMIQIMCFYMPWVLALVFWVFLLKSLRKSQKEFNTTANDGKEFSVMNSSVPMKNNNTKYESNNNISSNNNNNNSANSKFLAVKNHKNNNLNSSLNTSTIYLDQPTNGSRSISPNLESRTNNAENRLRSYNKITLMVVVLCFTNLICRLFTFVFIFEVIFDEYLKATNKTSYLSYDTSSPSVATNDSASNQYYVVDNSSQNKTTLIIENAKTHFPKFLSYSLLLNNIFLCINHSSNIFIYTFTNPRFKKNLYELFKPCNFSNLTKKFRINKNNQT